MDATSIYRIALGGDAKPDEWQLALATDSWPQVLIAPTGSGKTAAVTLGWAAHRRENPEVTPRRLVWCLPMRTLVEQTAEVVRDWFDRLADLDDGHRLPRPDEVHVLMGGAGSDKWMEEPERPSVLVGTQDMLLSRALMRGYASPAAKWPMAFALLHEDAQWVFDEVQLMNAGRATSAQLQAFRQTEARRARNDGRPPGIPSRSLWISATLDPQWLATVDHPAPESVFRVDPERAPSDSLVARRSSAAKRLVRSPVTPRGGTKADLADHVARLADAIVDAHRTGRRTLAVVNRVDRAQALYRALEKRLSGKKSAAPTLSLIHSRFRPADRKREMTRVVEPDDRHPNGRIVVATQAVEAGVDISAAVLFTEIAPWASLVQRFGRANRHAELSNGAEVYWIDLLPPTDEEADGKEARQLAVPYEVEELQAAKKRLLRLADVAPKHLPPPDAIEPSRQVIRRKDLDDLFDTDPDLTGFQVDISAWVRDAGDTDLRVFWRDLPEDGGQVPPRPRREELCAVSIGVARKWIAALRKRKIPIFQRDPQWRPGDRPKTGAAPPGWAPLQDDPWPGLVLLASPDAGGYRNAVGFTGNPKDKPEPVAPEEPDALASDESDGHDEDPLSQLGTVVTLADHLQHVAAEAESLCRALALDSGSRKTVVRAARWHDLGKTHEVFQDTMRRGLPEDREVRPEAPLAKTVRKSRHARPFRHELASALAFLAHEDWSRDADLTAYLIAAHHGKVRMNLRALPRERPPRNDRADARFARGVWEGDELPAFDLQGGERWEGGSLRLSIMELGLDDISLESWTERTRDLLADLGPFRLAWLETLVRIADWRASARERAGGHDGR